ncbi:MAG: SMP-30/gluconolactonase/LRE family protein [Bryobacteraceae bacterium]
MPKNSVLAIADYNDLCGENPLWDVKGQRLYWTDMTGRRFYSYDWGTRQSAIVSQDFEICGAAFNDTGSGDGTSWVVVNSSGIWLWNGLGTPQLVVSEVDGQRCNMNDCVADPRGRLFAGSWFYDPNRDDYALGHLIRVNQDGSAIIVDEGIHLSNGLGFAPDLRTLYFADSVERLIFAYDYDVRTGDIRNRREFVRVPRSSGLPDGLTVDAEGYVWCAHWFGGCVVRYDPDGVIERILSVPAKQTSSVAFGGPDLTDMFITSAALSDSLPLAPPGYAPESGYVGGSLFHANLGIAGREEYRARISIRQFS